VEPLEIGFKVEGDKAAETGFSIAAAAFTFAGSETGLAAAAAGDAGIPTGFAAFTSSFRLIAFSVVFKSASGAAAGGSLGGEGLFLTGGGGGAQVGRA